MEVTMGKLRKPRVGETALRAEVAEYALSKWWVWALLHTEHDTLGAVLRAATGLQSKTLVVFGPRCVILDDADEKNQDILVVKDGSGVVWCNVLEPGGLGPARPMPICTTKAFTTSIQKLVDDLNLTRGEAEALVALCRSWVGTDWRLDAGNLPEDRGVTETLN
jgi:hypothetical protein